MHTQPFCIIGIINPYFGLPKYLIQSKPSIYVFRIDIGLHVGKKQ